MLFFAIHKIACSVVTAFYTTCMTVALMGFVLEPLDRLLQQRLLSGSGCCNWIGCLYSWGAYFQWVLIIPIQCYASQLGMMERVVRALCVSWTVRYQNLAATLYPTPVSLTQCNIVVTFSSIPVHVHDKPRRAVATLAAIVLG